jgi:outer membrane protein
MRDTDPNWKYFTAVMRLSISAIVILAPGTVAAQNAPPEAVQNAAGATAIPLVRSGGGLPPARSSGVRRITLEQVKQQQTVSPNAGLLARLGQLSIEAAKQHRLGVQADYFPKLGATAANLHYSEFLGQVVAVRRPLLGFTTQVPVPLFSQNQTIAAVTFIQPITPLLQVRQAVRIARADERIAMAKAGVPVAKNSSDADVEETYFKLLIAQRRLISTEWKARNTENRPLYAAVGGGMVRASDPDPESVEVKRALLAATAEVRERTASLDRLMGWPDDTELELVPPDPLVENIRLEEVKDVSPAANNPDLVEAEQTVVKARAASALSKLAYVPSVAAVGGYMFQNAIPLVPSTFGYGGVIASYNLFDFGKRERAVKEARAQLGMAEIALQLTKVKLAANLKQSYVELERSRQVSQLAQKMGSSVAQLMNVSSTSESVEMRAARANVEVEMLEADLAHRQAYARLKALMGRQR